MSVIGTGVAAGVAQSVHQAQQVASKKDKKETDKQNQDERVQDLFESHLQTLEDADEATTPAQLRIDAEVPDHPQSHEVIRSKRNSQNDAQETPQVDAASGGQASPYIQPISDDKPLYHHLDVQG